MEVDFLDFGEQCQHLAKQALGKQAGEPVSGGFVRWVHVVLHCLRFEEGHSYREMPNRLEYMTEIRGVLGLNRGELPEYTTIHKSFDRLKMWVWRAHSTRQHVLRPPLTTSYYRQRSGSTVQTLKVTTLTDRESLAVLNVHISARWKHDTKTGPQVVRRNADDLFSVAANKAFLPLDHEIRVLRTRCRATHLTAWVEAVDVRT